MFLVISGFLSCCNNVNCDNAQICVKNVGNETIHYCWNCNSYDDSIAPGESTCLDVGPIYINLTTTSTVWVEFDSDHGTYRTEVNDCYIEKEIE
ncbi:MAG: hypothetical protein CVU11_04445 [Bacteroidetes bacterium HGW-Bacteroidetes-6]|nr:MAG: hypothetical protein CVU11_04445 [Bacteroidetes bacterium HGW-Bacteroidetes-6]